jgi:hypothetical protein
MQPYGIRLASLHLSFTYCGSGQLFGACVTRVGCPVQRPWQPPGGCRFGALIAQLFICRSGRIRQPGLETMHGSKMWRRCSHTIVASCDIRELHMRVHHASQLSYQPGCASSIRRRYLDVPLRTEDTTDMLSLVGGGGRGVLLLSLTRTPHSSKEYRADDFRLANFLHAVQMDTNHLPVMSGHAAPFV